MNPWLEFVLSAVFDRIGLAPEHLADLRKSGLNDDTIALQKIRDIPPDMTDKLLGFPTPKVVSAYLIPFPDPSGGWMANHVRMRIFPTLTDADGHSIKYLQPRYSGVRLFFPLATLEEALHGDGPLILAEGEKKSLCVSQLGLPAVGFCGVEGWHPRGSRELLPDFSFINLHDRVVDLVPDGDVADNPNVKRAVERFADALRGAGAHPRLVRLPEELVAP